VADSTRRSRRGPDTGGDRLTLTDCGSFAKVLVKGEGAAAVGFGAARRDGQGRLVVGRGPAEWLVLGRPETATATISDWDPPAGVDETTGRFVSLVDFTSARALVRLAGTAAPAVLAKLCAVDLARLQPGQAVRTALARIAADVIRDDDGSYLVAYERSYADYLVDVLADAGAEFGLQRREEP